MAKKRANGEGNIRKRADGRWEGRYTAGYQPMTAVVIVKRRTAMQMIGRMILAILFIMLSPCRAGAAAWLKVLCVRTKCFL